MTQGIIGSDGHVPVQDPNGLWKTWSISEIYTGAQGANRYVPKVKDYVVDPDTNEWWVVVSIDPSTLIARLNSIIDVPGGNLSDNDVLLGVGSGTSADTYRVYIDKTVMPHTLSVDARVRVPGSMLTKARLFIGSQLTGNEKLISAFYDQSGHLLGQDIPLELVGVGSYDTGMPNGAIITTNYAIKTVPTCYTTEDLPNGEYVTLVAYSDDGHIGYKRQLLAENTSFIRTTSAATKYITGISLESPFLSNSDPTLIQYPLNVPKVGLNLIGVVHYSDGSTIRLPVDNTKFSMFGFHDYVATIVGQALPLVLSYKLSPGEVVYGQTVSQNRALSQSYKAVTLDVDGSFTPKLFGYPVWIDALHGYRMEWFLYNLDRNLVFRVTPFVSYSPNGPLFNPTAYGVNQTLSVQINLRDVSGQFRSYIHTQTLSVALRAAGTERVTNWTIAYDPNQTTIFGLNNFAAMTFVNQNLRKVKIDCNELVFANWLERIYYLTKPLTNPSHEVKAPEPNMFAFVFGDHQVEFTIDQWNQELQISDQLLNNDTLFIKFFRRTPETDIHLGISAMPVYQN